MKQNDQTYYICKVLRATCLLVDKVDVWLKVAGHTALTDACFKILYLVGVFIEGQL